MSQLLPCIFCIHTGFFNARCAISSLEFFRMIMVNGGQRNIKRGNNNSIVTHPTNKMIRELFTLKTVI